MSETTQTTAIDTFQHFLRYAAQADTCIEVHEMPPLGGTAHFGHEGTKQIVSEIERLQKELKEARSILSRVAVVLDHEDPWDREDVAEWAEIAKAIRAIDGGGK